jgi:hypothetical protein
LLTGKDLLEKERLESNRLPFRKKRLEEVILSYQTNSSGLSTEAFNFRKQTLYQAIDRATADIDTWSSNDKFAYYRIYDIIRKLLMFGKMSTGRHSVRFSLILQKT